TVYAIGYSAADASELPDVAAQFADPEALSTLASSAEASGVIVATAPVGTNGSYEFKDLPAGYYYIFALPLPADWDGIVPAAGRGSIAFTNWTQLVEKKGCYDVLFKIRRWFDVTVLKWEELQNGAVQPGNGWTITATPQGDPWAVKRTGKTDASGGVVLSLTPGTWQIAETIKSGWTPVTPASVSITLDQYAPPGAVDPVIFKNREPVCYASITVEKNGLGTDANGGQVWLGPLAGWQITLSRPDGAMAAVTRTTDGTGKTTFSNLRPGVYNVTETVQPGWEAVSPNPQQVIIRDCENARVLFENLEVVGKLQISGTKYFRAWVPPYQGVTVGLSGWGITATLKGSNPAVYVTTTTDALGNYSFSEPTLAAAGMAIPGATITVCEEQRDHWIPVSPVCVDVRFPYPVPVDYKGVKVNFTNVQDPPLPGASTGGATSTATCAVGYTVRAGDNLSSIAAANGTTVRALTQLNGLANPNMIRAGQTLCIQ
ncbi:MAG TPA: LysM peptidoglycan-binding domain-containing protein, partial [Anaerolineae bacterium]|nr:LysM peptidoglycan-binding domain-containing protein [Anaerolineae bacterium]